MNRTSPAPACSENQEPPIYRQRPIPELQALIIGINAYQKIPALSGAVADANSIDRFLQQELLVPSDQIINLRDNAASRSAIVGAFRKLQDDPRIEPLAPILIYYAGHGSEVDSPNGRMAQGLKTQCIVPQDVGLPDEKGAVICPIPDYTLSVLLHDLARAKGNNITVILDCCHSASSTRGVLNPARVPSPAGPLQVPRPASCHDVGKGSRQILLTPNDHHISSAAQPRYVPSTSLPDLQDRLDHCILTQSNRTPPTRSEHTQYFQRGMRTHVLLAACGHGEKAFERVDGRGGFFTSCLLDILRSNRIDKLTYKSCIGKFVHLGTPESQNPVCEGEFVNRFFFNALVPGAHGSYIPIKACGSLEDRYYVLQAGLAQGITLGSKFSLHTHCTAGIDNPSLGTISFPSGRGVFCQVGFFLPEDVAQNINRLRSGGDPTIDCEYGRLISPGARSEDFVVYYDEGLFSTLQIREKDLLDPMQGTIHWADAEDIATIALGIETTTGRITLAVQTGPSGEKLKLPHTILPDANTIRFMLSEMAQWSWHALRTPDDELYGAPFRRKIELAIHKLEFDSSPGGGSASLLYPASENLNKDDVVNLVSSSEDSYGLRIVNRTSRKLFVYPFYFSVASQSIRSLFFKTHGSEQVDASVDAESEMTIGLEDDDMLPLKFQLDPRIELDVGFLRVFVTTSPADFESIVQPSPFAALGRAATDGDEFWDGIQFGHGLVGGTYDEPARALLAGLNFSEGQQRLGMRGTTSDMTVSRMEQLVGREPEMGRQHRSRAESPIGHEHKITSLSGLGDTLDASLDSGRKSDPVLGPEAILGFVHETQTKTESSAEVGYPQEDISAEMNPEPEPVYCEYEVVERPPLEQVRVEFDPAPGVDLWDVVQVKVVVQSSTDKVAFPNPIV